MLAQVLRPVAATFAPGAFPDLLIGLEGPDDAAVYRLSDDLALLDHGTGQEEVRPAIAVVIEYGDGTAETLSDLGAQLGDGAAPEVRSRRYIGCPHP